MSLNTLKWENTAMKRQDIIAAVGKKIAFARKTRKLTQEELARKAGRMLNTVANLERGRANPELLTLFDIAGALEMKASDLIDVENEPKKSRDKEAVLREILTLSRSFDERTLRIILRQLETLSESEKV